MALALQEKRVDGDADQGQRQGGAQAIAQMRGLHAPGDLPSQSCLGRALDGPAELAQITFYPSKR
jgi:hypothetical protein